MRTKILKGIGILILLALAVAIYNKKKIAQLYTVLHIFDEDQIAHNFMHMEDLFDTRTIEQSPSPTQLIKDISYTPIPSFSYEDSTIQVPQFIEDTRTMGLLVMRSDTIIYEEYYNEMSESTTHISWSVAKSVVATLLGIAYHDGLIKDLNEPITSYLPQLAASGYNEVKIKDILNMSSGVGFNEDYRDFNSDINRFGRAFALGSSYESFALSLKNERPPGTYNHYVSIDTQVLGMLLEKVTGKRLSVYLKEKLWDPMGMEHDAHWIIDETGMELALGGLNISLRDYAKLGLLYLQKGRWKDQQLVPAEWVEQAISPDAPHLMPGRDNQSSSNRYGYGFQWWIPEKPMGDFFAAGIYNQYIYVYPEKDFIAVKLSANHHFRIPGDESKYQHIDFFQAMARAF
ncbi:MAG: beta-lactamase family protein [Saprospiraceae bacterium]|nr:beta-lactamase family protein [Saprospiraceae bacterium]